MSDINNTGLSKPQMKNLMKFLSDATKIPVLGAGGGFAPIGTLNYYMGTVAPQGWLICDGTVYDIADYPEFAAFLASNYGSTNAFGGDGVTTFAVPNCRGEFMRMIGTNSHADQGSGANVGVHQDATVIPYSGKDSSTNIVGGYGLANTDSQNDTVQRRWVDTPSGDSNGTNFTTRPTNTSWNFVVKATVSGDANAHQYSTEEQIVGMTEDGKTIYEKTITGLSAATTWSQQYEARATISFATLGLSNIDFVRSATAYGTYQSEKYMYPASAVVDGTNITFGVHNAFTISKLTIQYTKTQ